MKTTRDGARILKREINKNVGMKVVITSKTLKSGEVRYAVVIRKGRHGRHICLRTFDNVQAAWNTYKALRAA